MHDNILFDGTTKKLAGFEVNIEDDECKGFLMMNT